MKTIDVSAAKYMALNWLVAKCERPDDVIEGRARFWIAKNHNGQVEIEVPGDRCYIAFSPATRWEQGGPIKSRELIMTKPYFYSAGYTHGSSGKWVWRAYVLGPDNLDDPFEQEDVSELGAAMRCYVASKLGHEVDVPDELV